MILNIIFINDYLVKNKLDFNGMKFLNIYEKVQINVNSVVLLKIQVIQQFVKNIR